MKKIMIALAAVAMAIGAQAATAPWKATITNVFLGDSVNKYTGSVYIMDAASYAMQTVFDNYVDGSMTLANIEAAAAGTIAAANGAAANKTFSYGEGGSKYSFYALIVDGDNMYFSTMLADKAASTSTTAATLGFGAQNNGTTTFSNVAAAQGFQGAGHWSQAVPEPTSGLLMLLGMAGLALRRRRA